MEAYIKKIGFHCKRTLIRAAFSANKPIKTTGFSFDKREEEGGRRNL